EESYRGDSRIVQHRVPHMWQSTQGALDKKDSAESIVASANILKTAHQEDVMTAPADANTRDYNGVTIPTAGTFSIDPAHTRVGFVARHLMVSKVRGSFTSAKGTLI